jgi:hypothetical protein
MYDRIRLDELSELATVTLGLEFLEQVLQIVVGYDPYQMILRLHHQIQALAPSIVIGGERLGQLLQGDCRPKGHDVRPQDFADEQDFQGIDGILTAIEEDGIHMAEEPPEPLLQGEGLERLGQRSDDGPAYDHAQ